MTFDNISQLRVKSITPKKKLVNAERAKFMNISQKMNEPVIEYVLQQATRYCKLEKMGSEKQSIQEVLIQMKLVNGLQNEAY